MADCHTFYDELRFDVRDPHLTHVYVYIRCEGDCPHFIQGWHHKEFLATVPTKDIYLGLWHPDNPEGDPMMWELKAPPSDERNRTLDEVVKVVCEVAMQESIDRGTVEDTAAPLFAVAHKLEGMKS